MSTSTDWAKGKRLLLMQKLLLHATPVTLVKARLGPAISGPVDTHVPVSMCAGRQCRQPWKRARQAGWGKGVCEARILSRSSSLGPACLSVVSPHYMEHALPAHSWQMPASVFDLFWGPSGTLPLLTFSSGSWSTNTSHMNPFHMYGFLNHFQFDNLHLYMAKGTQYRLVIFRSQCHI